jgi:hypothetical protein
MIKASGKYDIEKALYDYEEYSDDFDEGEEEEAEGDQQELTLIMTNYQKALEDEKNEETTYTMDWGTGGT